MAEVRLFAILRELAGASRVTADGTTVDEVLQGLRSRYGGRFAAILDVSSVVVDGERAAGDTELAGNEELAILPPVSGGSA